MAKTRLPAGTAGYCKRMQKMQCTYVYMCAYIYIYIHICVSTILKGVLATYFCDLHTYARVLMATDYREWSHPTGYSCRCQESVRSYSESCILLARNDPRPCEQESWFRDLHRVPGFRFRVPLEWHPLGLPSCVRIAGWTAIP